MFKERWDIFCKVIDNYGDAGVCWRLANQLTNEYGKRVRLWIDNLDALACIAPMVTTDNDSQKINSKLSVHCWAEPFPENSPAHVVIEAFACNIPLSYLHQMAAQQHKPVWINLEYLNEEDWVSRYHGLKSTHPTLNLTKYFFFPGLTAGGLLRETDLRQRQQEWERRHVQKPYLQSEIKVSLFTYENPALISLLETWIHGQRPIHCLVPNGPAATQAQHFFGKQTFAAGQYVEKGMLRLEVLPFVAQENYDALLWQTDLNFVRGEDSFVRGQLAGKPIIWHIYPQSEGAHMHKLSAFFKRYAKDSNQPEQIALRNINFSWNERKDCSDAWQALCPYLDKLKLHAQNWTDYLYSQASLAQQLCFFVEKTPKEAN